MQSWTEAIKKCLEFEAMKVAVICGGNSSEREISLLSGASVCEALRERFITVELFDPAEAGFVESLTLLCPTVAFLALHGRGGEDGQIQGFLEELGIPHTGSGIMASALAMDKVLAKRILSSYGLLTPAFIEINSIDGKSCVRDFMMEHGGRCVIKPSQEGSSLGIYIVESEPEMEDAIEKALSYSKSVLAEEYVAGREMTVGVLGHGDRLSALPIIEIIPKNSHYDYESKYSEGGSVHVCPAEIENPIEILCKRVAIEAHKSLRCEGVSRTDIILDGDSNAWVLEVNTLPGMTNTSLLPDAARSARICFSDLCLALIGFSLLGSDD